MGAISFNIRKGMLPRVLFTSLTLGIRKHKKESESQEFQQKKIRLTLGCLFPGFPCKSPVHKHPNFGMYLRSDRFLIDHFLGEMFIEPMGIPNCDVENLWRHWHRPWPLT
jgi:hypothetical protein